MAKSASVNLTADVTAQKVFTTRGDKQGVVYLVDAAADYGTGVLTILTKPGGSNMAYQVVATPAVGDQDIVWVGANMDIAVTLAGATAPDTDISFSQV